MYFLMSIMSDTTETITISLQEYHSYQQQSLEQQALITKLQHELDWLKRQLFGQKSERFIPDQSQLSLELGIENAPLPQQTQPVTYQRTQGRKSPGHSRGEMPTHLPIHDTTIQPDQDVSGWRKIGEEISWEYEYTPGSLFINRTIRPTYASPDNQSLITAPLPSRPVEKGNFSAGFMAHVTVDKYLYHLPLYRQIQKFKNEHQTLFAESTFVDIVNRSCFWYESVYNHMRDDLLCASYLMADETTMPVLIKVTKKKTHKGYYWVYFDPLRKIALFEYRHGRGREGPNEFLKDFKGILQIDGYQGYNDIVAKDAVQRAACMAHVRRYFEKALEYNQEKAAFALQSIKAWFAVEAQSREEGLSHQQRLQRRVAAGLQTLFDDFKKWCMHQCAQELPTSPIRKACEYALGQWEGFNPYLNDGRVELSNNLVENTIRPVVIGRKNYLFKGSEKSAQRGAMIYSLITTAKLHGLEPYTYMKSLLEKLPAMKANQIHTLMPYAQ